MVASERLGDATGRDMATGVLIGVLRHLRKIALAQDNGHITDGQLLERFLGQRDETAFEAILQRHGPMVLGVCRRVLRNCDDADDAFQATFLSLIRKAATIRHGNSLAGWLHRAAFRAALEARTVRRRRRERQVIAMPEPEAADGGNTWSDVRSMIDQELN